MSDASVASADAAAASAVPASAALSQSTTVAVTVLVGLLSLSIFALRSYLRKTALKKLPGALAPTGTLFFSVGALNMVGGSMSPLLRAGLSESAGPEEQGLCLTGIAAIETTTVVWAPLLFGYLWSLTEPANPTVAFVVFAGIAVVMLAMALHTALCWPRPRS